MNLSEWTVQKMIYTLDYYVQKSRLNAAAKEISAELCKRLA